MNATEDEGYKPTQIREMRAAGTYSRDPNLPSFLQKERLRFTHMVGNLNPLRFREPKSQSADTFENYLSELDAVIRRRI